MNAYVQNMIPRIMKAEAQGNFSERNRLAHLLFQKHKIVVFGHMRVQTVYVRGQKQYATSMYKKGTLVGPIMFNVGPFHASVAHWLYIKEIAHGGETPV